MRLPIPSPGILFSGAKMVRTSRTVGTKVGPKAAMTHLRECIFGVADKLSICEHAFIDEKQISSSASTTSFNADTTEALGTY